MEWPVLPSGIRQCRTMPKKVSRLSALFIKLTHWEFWPFSVIYLPVFFYYGWLSMRARSFFFFTASNPSIEFGGMLGERKSDIFSMIPSKYIPNTVLITRGNVQHATRASKEVGYPLIAKPDVGERGYWVKKIEHEEELISYVLSCPANFLIQEFVTYPLEFGIFYVKYPGQQGRITSVVRKEFLKVVGDGKNSIRQLIMKQPRAILTADLNSSFLRLNGNRIPCEGEVTLIEPIGNHCRGTMFIDDSHEIDSKLNVAMNALADEIKDFYFGRFDIKCRSLDDLRMLRHFKILELNGAGAEPGHIYQPGYSLWKAYGNILWHLHALSDISMENHKQGVPYWSLKRGYKKWRRHIAYHKLLNGL